MASALSLTGALPSGNVPSGTDVPSGNVPSGTDVPSGTSVSPGTPVPFGNVPSGTDVPAGTPVHPGTPAPSGTPVPSGAAVPHGTVPQATDIQILIQHPGSNQNIVPTVPHIPMRTAYSLTVHASIFSISTIAGIFLTVGATKATAAGSKVPQSDLDHSKKMLELYGKVAVPYMSAFFMYYAIPRATKFWCVIRLIYDEINMVLGFIALVLMSGGFSTTNSLVYMGCWFGAVTLVRLIYLVINQKFDFHGRERPIPF